MSDEPHVSRTIRTPHATIAINGTLGEVDQLYRDFTAHLLASGRYTIPAPGDDPWSGFDHDEPNVDHLARRVSDLEHTLSESEDHELLQELRRKIAILILERDEWKMAFTDLDHSIASALRTLQDGHDLTVHEAIVIDVLSLLPT